MGEPAPPEESSDAIASRDAEALSSASPQGVEHVTTRCPECGYVVRKERHARRTRRRWRWALASLPLFALAYGALVGPDVVEQGARGAIPGLVLVYGPYDLRALAEPDLYPEPTGRVARAMFGELRRRLDEHRLTRWQQQAVQRRLRAAYARIDRLGVSSDDLDALNRLEATTTSRLSGDVSIEQLRAEIARAGLTIDAESAHTDRWCFALDQATAPSVVAILDAAVLEGASAWTIRNGRISLGTHREIAERTRYEVFDLHEIAPVVAYWFRWGGCEFGTTKDDPLQRGVSASDAEAITDLIQQFVDPIEWIAQGGVLADIHRLDEIVVVRARLSTLVKVHRLLKSLSAMQRGSVPEAVPVVVYSAASKAQFDVRWNDTRDIVERAAEARASREPTSNDYVPTADEALRLGWIHNSLAADDLIDQLTATIDPDHWDRNGGDALIARFNGMLLVATTPANHQRIEQFLDDLRTGRVALPVE